MTAFESQGSALKCTVTTNVKAHESEIAFCVGEISKIEEHILDLKKEHSELVRFQADGEQQNLLLETFCQNCDLKLFWGHIDLVVQVAGLQHRLEGQSRTQNFMSFESGQLAEQLH